MNKNAGKNYWTPADVARRWHWHAESVRRKIRRGEISSVVIGRRRLIPEDEITRIETDGLVLNTNHPNHQ